MAANPHPYSLYLDEDGLTSYVFHSSNGAVYSVYFNLREYDHYLDNYPSLFNNGYGFGFFRMTKPLRRPMFDERVFPTVAAIIHAFATRTGNDIVLLYHCDHSDGKQAARDTLFEEWFEQSPFSQQYKRFRYEAYIQETGVSHFMGYLTPLSNPNIEQVQLEFDACAFNLMQDKIT